MVVPAPGRLSITMLCPRRADTCWVTTRASTSTGEPGVYGTITLIGFDGYVCALAIVAQHTIASIAKVRLPYMSRSLVDPRVEDIRSRSAGLGIA
jgi:hypothetical protein